jgi:uncharacterized protein
MNKAIWLGLIGVAGMAMGSGPAFGFDQPPAQKNTNFGLERVRLLPGPFDEARQRDLQYLLSLDPDRLLVMYRSTAAFYSGAAYRQPYGGWESPVSEQRGTILGHYLSACALMYASTGDPRLKERTAYLVAELAKCQQNLAKDGYHPGYLAAVPEFFFDFVDGREPVWAPWYAMHKVMAGLLDVWVHTGNPQALQVLNRLADWVKFRVDRLTPAQMQGALKREAGGMNEVLANLAAVSGDSDRLRLAQAFNRPALFAPLARGEDQLDGLHANTQIPQIIGAAREYELTGRTEYRDVANFFWREVALRRSDVIGGDGDHERFFPVADFPAHLGAATDETCCTYNMLKLTEHIFAWEPQASTMDFYERALYNDILASQDPASGMVTYFVPTKPGLFKAYSTPDRSFWCCVGTGMENHAKYGEEIYTHDEHSLYVNLFIPSELSWPERGLTLRQETRFPEESSTRLRLALAQPKRLALKVRQPGWCRTGITINLNGHPVAARADASGYVTLDREWRDGDMIEVGLPLTLRAEALPGDPRTLALLYGPIVLAGELGTEGMPPDGLYIEDAGKFEHWPAVPVPLLIGGTAAILAGIHSVPGQPLTFRTEGIGRPRDVTLIPFYRLHHQRYTIYWKTAVPSSTVASATSR